MVSFPWDIVDLNSVSGLSVPNSRGALGPEYILALGASEPLWWSPATDASFPSQSRGPILWKCCSRAWTCLSLWTVPQDTQDGGCPTRPWGKVWGCLLCWVWFRVLSSRLSCQEQCQESSCAVCDELQCSQFRSTELQWVTRSAITPTWDNQCRALLV